MAWDFRPRMRVVCLDDDFGEGWSVALPRKGQVCTVTGIDWYPKGTSFPSDPGGWAPLSEDCTFLELAEFGKSSFDAEHFRPLDEKRIDCFRVHLAPKRVEVVA